MSEHETQNEEAIRKIKEIEDLLPRPGRSRNLEDGASGMMPFDEGAEAGRESAKVFKSSLQEFKRSFQA